MIEIFNNKNFFFDRNSDLDSLKKSKELYNSSFMLFEQFKYRIVKAWINIINSWLKYLTIRIFTFDQNSDLVLKIKKLKVQYRIIYQSVDLK